MTTITRNTARLLAPLFVALVLLISLSVPANAAAERYCRTAWNTTVCVSYDRATRVAQARVTNNTSGPIFNAYLQLGPENSPRWAYNQRYLERGHTMYATRYSVSAPSAPLCAGFMMSPGQVTWTNAWCHDYTP